MENKRRNSLIKVTSEQLSALKKSKIQMHSQSRFIVQMNSKDMERDLFVPSKIYPNSSFRPAEPRHASFIHPRSHPLWRIRAPLPYPSFCNSKYCSSTHREMVPIRYGMLHLVYICSLNFLYYIDIRHILLTWSGKM